MLGFYLIGNKDEKSETVVQFLRVLKLVEDDLFADVYCDVNYRKNIKDRNPIHLPGNDDVRKLLEECYRIINAVNSYDHPSEFYVSIRAATATVLIIFNARRSGEPVRLQLYQWLEALNCEWVDRIALPEDFNNNMLITYQTGKGADHLVSVIFHPETHKAMKFSTSEEVRRDAGVLGTNKYIFDSTQKSNLHTSGWHCINIILERLSLKGAINATKNKHRVATLLGKLQLEEKEKEFIFKHFGHSKNMNQNVYQAAAGPLQLKCKSSAFWTSTNLSREIIWLKIIH